MSWLKKFLGMAEAAGSPVKETLELVPVAEGDPFTREHDLIRRLLAEQRVERETKGVSYHTGAVKRLEAFVRMMALDGQEQARLIGCMVGWLSVLDTRASAFLLRTRDQDNLHLNQGWNDVWEPRRVVCDAMEALLKRKPPLAPETVRAMLDWCNQDPSRPLITHWYPLAQLVSALEELVKSGVDLEDWSPAITLFGGNMRRSASDNQIRKLAERVDDLSGRSPELPLVQGEAWADAAIADIAGLPESVRSSWVGLLQHCKSAGGTSPNTKWWEQTRKLMDAAGSGDVAASATRWFALVDKKRTISSLSERQWAERCAGEVFDRMHSNLYQLLPAERLNHKHLHKLRETIVQSDDPWNFLRNFSTQAEVIALFGERAPMVNLAASPRAYDPVEDRMILQPHMDVLCGLAWTCALIKDAAVARALSGLAASCFSKVPGIGPRAVRVGNACVGALGMMATSDALGQLALLKVKVKFGGAQIAIDKALRKLSEQLGIPRDELEEMSVPAYGMEEVGILSQQIGDFTAVLSITGSRTTELVWRRADGKLQKSAPASAKQENPDDLKEVMAAKKDIEKMLPAQVERLDSLYLQRKSWPFATWRERYLDHPLVGALARRLIWSFTADGVSAAGVWRKQGICDYSGNPLLIDEDSTSVSLWHPLHQTAADIEAWRDFLEREEIVQPFKQAHREIYLVAPAEEATRVYSNRFAAHLLKQHQFNALCVARGWKNRLRLMVDDQYPPATRHLPAWGVRAEYWIEGAGTEHGEDTLESGAYRYIATDQVRFYQEGATQATAHAGGGGYSVGPYQESVPPLPLVEVDPLVFSEIMRDVDLFTGVASVGNDPTWLDGGTNENRRDNWERTAFGELNGSAQTRKAILERLVPKLKIAAQCVLGDRFLEVQGKRHAYKIHLGSGNILISPQGKYLCIVPAQSQVDKAGGKLFLPFEGDRTLSVIISKAFLLAADDKITDPTILRQL